VRFARFPIEGALAFVLIAVCAVPAVAWAPFDHRASGASRFGYQPCHGGMVGLGFGFSPWWGPYDAYAPPAYAYPPPDYSVPPSPRMSTQSELGICHEFESTVIVSGQAQIARGLACQEADGSWRIVR
jgi:hypothetical protein